MELDATRRQHFTQIGAIPVETVLGRRQKGSPGGTRRGLASHKELERLHRKDWLELSRIIEEKWTLTGTI
ncbi:hypothetical protein NPIL_686921 [Nephila pilipes]|uniref:Uncharacterized protein n=1 Tax=Nephila pilipes TaxID=299642 RepID=A0A8X6T4S8_NEPPI|nr:hypothetical protein NPIL_686921 [Nephila pilipes]